MARITPSVGRDLSDYEDGVWYKLTLSKIAKGNAKQSQFGPAMVLDFDNAEGQPGPGCLASSKLNDAPNGKPAKLKAALNSLLGHAPTTPIVAFDDETFEVEYEGEVVEQIEVGLRLEARGEWSETDSPQYNLVAFRPLGAAPKSKSAKSAAAEGQKTSASAPPF